MWKTIVKLIEDYGKNPLVVAIVAALLGALLTKLLPWLFHKLGTLGSAALALFGGRWQDYRFEQRYLNWLIDRHRTLGQLPSNVAVSTGGQAAELEQIYVALSVTPGGMATSDDIEPSVPREEFDLMRRRPSGWMRLIPERFRPQRAAARVMWGALSSSTCAWLFAATPALARPR